MPLQARCSEHKLRTSSMVSAVREERRGISNRCALAMKCFRVFSALMLGHLYKIPVYLGKGKVVIVHSQQKQMLKGLWFGRCFFMKLVLIYWSSFLSPEIFIGESYRSIGEDYSLALSVFILSNKE